MFPADSLVRLHQYQYMVEPADVRKESAEDSCRLYGQATAL